MTHKRNHDRPHLGRPLALGIGALAAAVAGGAVALGSVPGAMTGSALVVVEVAHSGAVMVKAAGAPVSRIFVARGDRVKAGDLLAEVDTTALDREIAELRGKADDARRTLEAVRVEAQTFAVLIEQDLVPRERLQDLEARTGEIEKNAGRLMELLTGAEQRLAQAQIRAPVGGLVRPLPGADAIVLAPAHAPLLAIEPDRDHVVLEGRMTARQVEAARQAAQLRVTEQGAAFARRTFVSSRLVWVDALQPAGQGSDSLVAVRFEVAAAESVLRDIPMTAGTRLLVAVPEPNVSLAGQLAPTLARTLKLPSFRNSSVE